MVPGTPWWVCAVCGYRNKPRPVTNSLGVLPADHKLFDPAWRAAHCEQCGAERQPDAPEYQP